MSDGNDWMNHDTDDTIFICWSSEDVKHIRSDLTEEQCREVLHKVKRSHDATMGISWEVIETIADDMYPKKDLANE